MMEKQRIVFMGTPDFAVPALQAIHAAGHTIAAVFTQPDKQRGRGKKVSFSPVKEAALTLGLPVHQPDSLRPAASVALVRSYAPTVIVVIAYGKILPREILDIPPYGCLNVHASLLPRFRGAAPIQYAIKEGDGVSGVTIMGLDEGMDTGPILKQAEIRLTTKETTGTLFAKLAQLGAQTLLPVLAELSQALRQARPQDERLAVYTAKITKEMTNIDWHQDAAVIERWLRTLDPHPGAYTFWQGQRLKIWAADVTEGGDAAPGTIIAVTKKALIVQAGKGALRITELQPESRKRMAAAQFLQSHQPAVGEKLTAAG